MSYLPRTLLVLILCWAIAVTALAQQYPFAGGEAGGYSATSTAAPVTFSGKVSSIKIFSGGAGDGTARAETDNLQLSGEPQVLSLYFGGITDGWSEATTAPKQTLSGQTAKLTLFYGGESDGAAIYFSEVQTLSGMVPDLTLYKGGPTDGWATAQLSEELALDGSLHTPTLFQGGNKDGWAAAEVQNQTLNGEFQNLIMFNGGSEDGFATTLMSERGLDGLTYTPTLYFGGGADGWAMYTSESQSLGGSEEQLVLFRGGIGNGYDVAMALPPQEPLPVELFYFKAFRRSDNQVELRWITASEYDNAGFEIWRQDSGGNWYKVGYRQGIGTSYVSNHYNYLDANYRKSITYYRLKQLDHDGTATFSKVVAVPGAIARQRSSAWPIPVKDYLTVQAAIPDTPALLTLYSTNARLLMSKTFEDQTRIDLRHLPNGLYLLYVLQDGETPAIIKVVVEK
ncbi:T9SS type A sorting domain-containing protein [Pontibacter korlensis]|uniref:T9SS type A sorting domain-containing protein n=1 Tax=Pontibacter korlensis TaxID=400092 RepID=UPI000697F7E4|nr:T9SS type A sorting domain-containing protein [Pontibacter korlensis]